MVRAQHRLILALLLVSLALVLAACGSGPRSASGQAAQTGNVAADDGEVVVVTIKNFKFEPAHIAVAPQPVRFRTRIPRPTTSCRYRRRRRARIIRPCLSSELRRTKLEYD